MAAPRYRKRTDGNHKEVARALRAAGADVISIGEPLDLLVGIRRQNFLLEIKTDETDYGKNDRGTPAQKKFKESWRGQWAQAYTAEEAIALISPRQPEGLTCSICDGPFDRELEGGTTGSIGILPVAFCPTCLAGVLDFAEFWLGMPREET